MGDPHLLATGGLSPMTLPDGRDDKVAFLPRSLAGERLGVRLETPQSCQINPGLSS